MSTDATVQPIVEHIYDVVVAPDRLGELLDVWLQHLQGAGGTARFALLGEPGLLPHIERVEAALKQLLEAGEGDLPEVGPAVWAQANRAAALVVTRTGTIVAINNQARMTFGIETGARLESLPIEPSDLEILSSRLARAPSQRTDGDDGGTGAAAGEGQRPVPATLLRLRLRSQPVPVLIRLIQPIAGNPDHVGLLSTVLAWPAGLSDLLQNSFALTTAEVDVLRDLALGYSVKDICARSGRSEPTVRSHVQAVLAKTETRSQIELIRLSLGLMESVQPETLVPAVENTGDPTGRGNSYDTIVLADGRRLDYLVVGDRSGRPFFLFPSDIGLMRLPAACEADIEQRGWRMIVPVRAGYGWSSPCPRGRHVHDVAIDDTRALMHHLGILRAPILTICDDNRLATDLACRHPNLVSAIIALGGVMPARLPKHYQRMSKWSRFISINARHAPRTMPYIAMTFYTFARRVGPKRFMETVMSDSKSDVALLSDPDIINQMIRGSEVSFRSDFTAHAAWAAEVIANLSSDWSGLLARCPAPIIMFHGHQDPFSPFETVREYADGNPNITLHDYPEYGQLLYPLWPDIAAELAKFIGK